MRFYVDGELLDVQRVPNSDPVETCPYAPGDTSIGGGIVGSLEGLGAFDVELTQEEVCVFD